MRIKYIEIQNFRKLKSCRIDLEPTTTLFVGANNSGKTSAMVALERFLVREKDFRTTDVTLDNWDGINRIAERWENPVSADGAPDTSIEPWAPLLPTMDVWLEVGDAEVHRVVHIIPTLDWEGGHLGVRLRLEPKNLEKLVADYVHHRNARKNALNASPGGTGAGDEKFNPWPRSMRDFLDRDLHKYFGVASYKLDPSQLRDPERGLVYPQPLSAEAVPLDSHALRKLVRVDKVNAYREVTDGTKRKLSAQFSDYYQKHLDPTKFLEPEDIESLRSLEEALSKHDSKLQLGFEDVLQQLRTLNYPGFADPTITITTGRVDTAEVLRRDAKVELDLHDVSAGEAPVSGLRLPEELNGLGFQNLISMFVDLISFRDGWMRVGKQGKLPDDDSLGPEPLHLVLVEEPEAHLHVQIQQVFVRKAYDLLRGHEELREGEGALVTQLVLSTHSSHIAHEVDFGCLRYFRRRPKDGTNRLPVSTVVNLSTFADSAKRDEATRFALRYLRATHCDLFFADAAILVEGQAERLLVPAFIRKHFDKLHTGYIAMLEIGGSHAFTLKPLIDSLGITTLVITDIDAVDPSKNRSSVRPEQGKGYQSCNKTLETWLGQKSHGGHLKDLDTLLAMSEDDKTWRLSDFSVRFAFQTRLTNETPEVVPGTFEDALVLANLAYFGRLSGEVSPSTAKVVCDIGDKTTPDDTLASSLYETVNQKGFRKGDFALDILLAGDPSSLTVPSYIREGLQWLQDQVACPRAAQPRPSDEVPGNTKEDGR